MQPITRQMFCSNIEMIIILISSFFHLFFSFVKTGKEERGEGGGGGGGVRMKTAPLIRDMMYIHTHTVTNPGRYKI